MQFKRLQRLLVVTFGEGRLGHRASLVWRAIRLAVAGGQVAAQREALARATAALDRAIDVLLPGLGGSVYAQNGGNERAGRQTGLMA